MNATTLAKLIRRTRFDSRAEVAAVLASIASAMDTQFKGGALDEAIEKIDAAADLLTYEAAQTQARSKASVARIAEVMASFKCGVAL